MPIRATWTGGVAVERPGVALVLDDHHRAGVGHGEVAARNAHVGLEILLAQVAPGDVGQAAVLGAERLAELLGEQLAHVGGRQVHGGRDDVDGPLAGQLHDVLAQVGLHGADARRGQARGSAPSPR